MKFKVIRIKIKIKFGLIKLVKLKANWFNLMMKKKNLPIIKKHRIFIRLGKKKELINDSKIKKSDWKSFWRYDESKGWEEWIRKKKCWIRSLIQNKNK